MIRCLILDDEEPARRELRTLLSAHPEIEIVGDAGDVDTAIRLTKSLAPELVLVDVKLAGETGFDYVARLAERLPPHVVFVTAYDQFALRAFECNALDYLLKPVHPERLAVTLQRAGASPMPVRRATADDVVYLKAASMARLVPWRDVRHIVSEGNYTRVRLEDGIEPLIPRTLKDWLAFVPENIFRQTHRTAIVRLDAIREVVVEGERRQLRLIDGTLLPVSRTHWPELKAALERRG